MTKTKERERETERKKWKKKRKRTKKDKERKLKKKKIKVIIRRRLFFASCVQSARSAMLCFFPTCCEPVAKLDFYKFGWIWYYFSPFKLLEKLHRMFWYCNSCCPCLLCFTKYFGAKCAPKRWWTKNGLLSLSIWIDKQNSELFCGNNTQIEVHNLKITKFFRLRK